MNNLRYGKLRTISWVTITCDYDSEIHRRFELNRTYIENKFVGINVRVCGYILCIYYL